MTQSSSRRVLVIDDDETACVAMAALLRQAGHEVHVHPTPIGASRAVRSLGIETVVCDLEMPAMRGDALARLFRQSEALARIAIVLVTGTPREQLLDLLASHTVDAIVQKSQLHRELVAAVDEARPTGGRGERRVQGPASR